MSLIYGKAQSGDFDRLNELFIEMLRTIYNTEQVADIVVAVIIYMAGFTRIIKEFLNGKYSKKKPEKDIRDTVVTSKKEGE